MSETVFGRNIVFFYGEENVASKRKKSDIVDESVGMNEEFVESIGLSLVFEKEFV